MIEGHSLALHFFSPFQAGFLVKNWLYLLWLIGNRVLQPTLAELAVSILFLTGVVSVLLRHQIQQLGTGRITHLFFWTLLAEVGHC